MYPLRRYLSAIQNLSQSLIILIKHEYFSWLQEQSRSQDFELTFPMIFFVFILTSGSASSTLRFLGQSPLTEKKCLDAVSVVISHESSEYRFKYRINKWINSKLTDNCIYLSNQNLDTFAIDLESGTFSGTFSKDGLYTFEGNSKFLVVKKALKQSLGKCSSVEGKDKLI